MVNNRLKKKILLCGLGPVGGFFVTYITYKYPEAFDITVYEPKLGKFNRKQIFTIDPLVLESIKRDLPPIIYEKMIKIGCFVHNGERASDAKCYINNSKNKALTIKIMDMENIFYEYIKENLPDINLIKREYKDTKNKKNKEYDYLISATGGRDNLGELIGNKYKKEHISNGMIITFDPKKHKIFKNENDELNKHIEKQLIQHRYRGFRSKKSNFYMGVQLGKNEIEELTNFVEENGKISYKNMSKNLSEIINNGLKKYEMEDIKKDTLEVSFFPIIRKYCTIPAGYINNSSIVFLVGDSLTTPHFFSGMGGKFWI